MKGKEQMSHLQHGKRFRIRDILAILRLSKQDVRFNPLAKICNVHFEHRQDCPVKKTCGDESTIAFDQSCTCGRLGAHLHPHDDPTCENLTIAKYVEDRYLIETNRPKSFLEIKKSVTV